MLIGDRCSSQYCLHTEVSLTTEAGASFLDAFHLMFFHFLHRTRLLPQVTQW